MNDKILVVDDSRSIRTLVSRKLESLGIQVDVAACLAEVQDLLEGHSSEYLMAVADLNLPDAPDGEVVDYISQHGISSVVLTGTFDEDLRKRLYHKNIIDYLIKEGGRDLELIANTVARLRANADVKILVVDDSRFSRNYINKLLCRQHFQVIEAENGLEGLHLVEQHPEIKMVITDYNMPEMDGFELISKLRQEHGKDMLSIIGLSASEDDHVTAKFLKLGANDFLKKPFGTEEFYCRINQNLELVEMIQKIKEASNTDFLTKLFNRRYFFDNGTRSYLRAVKDEKPIAILMLDIDFFKKINDTYGHDGGDMALVKVAKILKDSSRPSDIVSRFGGEEFCLLFVDIDEESAVRKAEQIRTAVEDTIFTFENQSFYCTVSIGVACSYNDNLAQMIKTADDRLYTAKNTGRNRVVHC